MPRNQSTKTRPTPIKTVCGGAPPSTSTGSGVPAPSPSSLGGAGVGLAGGGDGSGGVGGDDDFVATVLGVVGVSAVAYWLAG